MPFLGRPQPNPVRKELLIEFGLPKEGPIAVEVFDVMGRHVRTLFKASQHAGVYQLHWDLLDDAGGRVAAGMYYLRFTHDRSHVQRVVVFE